MQSTALSTALSTAPTAEAVTAEFVLQLIKDLMAPCTCPGRGGHVNRACAHWDAPIRTAAVGKAAREAAIAGLAAAG